MMMCVLILILILLLILLLLSDVFMCLVLFMGCGDVCDDVDV